MRKIIIILFLMTLVFSSCTAKETGPDTPCTTNDDCWCRSFDGTKFLPGNTQGTCCTEDYKTRTNSDCEINKCLRCFYE